ncbi:hypothetical protein BST61_g4090 [Cercospora zeina]
MRFEIAALLTMVMAVFARPLAAGPGDHENNCHAIIFCAHSERLSGASKLDAEASGLRRACSAQDKSTLNVYRGIGKN